MSRILVVDDDPDMRALIGAYLQGAGHVVEFAADGEAGAAAARRSVPDLIITDFQMPKLDGFGLFGSVRAEASTAKTPVVMVTSQNSREMMQKALRLGVDDFLGKPFDKDNLLRVADAQLRARRMADLPRTPPATPAAVPALRAEFSGTVVSCEIRGLEWLVGALQPDEIETLVAQFVREAEIVASEQRGRLMHVDARRFHAVFGDAHADAGPHPTRALNAALGLVLAAQRLKPWMVKQFPHCDVAEFIIGVGVHTGLVQVHLPGGGKGAQRLEGESVEIAEFLAQSCPKLRWSIAASRATAKSDRFAFTVGRGAQLRMASGGTVLAVEVKGPLYSDQDRPEVRSAAVLLEAAIERNAALLATTAAPPRKIANTEQLLITSDLEFIKGYVVARRLAHDRIVSVYLADPVAGGPHVVLKVVALPEDKTKLPPLQRWVEKYKAFQGIDHPSVARVLAQGLTDKYLYLVQEYCPGGDLRNLIAERMVVDDVVKAMLRLTAGLRAALQKGFFHGDLAPANVMIRADGTLAIVDFSFATAVEYAMGEAEAGVIVRRPDYLAPEMINGEKPDEQSDVYTLGLLLHEMLTGKRAYDSPDLSKVMADHLSAPVPKLPEVYARFQPLLDKLMAKKRNERFTSVQEILSFMARAGLQA